jgi:probable biosynthetic protein (TIGR04098 family)
MPHLVPGQLSEVELTKLFGAFLWGDISRLVGQPPSEIVNEFGERLYASFLCFELSLGARSMTALGEDSRLAVHHRLDLYAGKFAEGFVLFDEGEPLADLPAIKSRDDLEQLDTPWAYALNGFVTRAESNTRLKLFTPAGIDANSKNVGNRPLGLTDHESVFSTGVIRDWSSACEPVPIQSARDEPIEYVLVPESDLNGAGLVYFARYIAIMNYGERVFLRERLARPFSTHLVRCLSTDHRRTYFFANADDTDVVQIYPRVAMLPAAAFPGAASAGPLYRVPFRLQLRFDLYRKSDGVLMATSVVRKSLTIPAHMKALLNEARRFAAGFVSGEV